MTENNDTKPADTYPFSSDYILQKPDFFSLTRIPNPNGEVTYVITFLEQKNVPIVGPAVHSVNQTAVIRSSVQITQSFFNDLIRIRAQLDNQSTSERGAE